MAWRKPPPPPAEPPARLRGFDPADWPDPADWADDAAVIESSMSSWTACTDKPGMWQHRLSAQWRAERRFDAARDAWAEENGVSMLDWLLGNLDFPWARKGDGHGV